MVCRFQKLLQIVFAVKLSSRPNLFTSNSYIIANLSEWIFTTREWVGWYLGWHEWFCCFQKHLSQNYSKASDSSWIKCNESKPLKFVQQESHALFYSFFVIHECFSVFRLSSKLNPPMEPSAKGQPEKKVCGEHRTWDRQAPQPERPAILALFSCCKKHAKNWKFTMS